MNTPIEYTMIDWAPSLVDPAWIDQADEIAAQLKAEAIRIRSEMTCEPCLFELLALQKAESFLLAADTYMTIAKGEKK